MNEWTTVNVVDTTAIEQDIKDGVELVDIAIRYDLPLKTIKLIKEDMDVSKDA
jgi:hypothetical protein